MKHFRLGGVASDIFISIYILVTLYLRFKFESQKPTGIFESIVLGICFVTIIWALIKLKFLNPNWFGLFNSKSTKS